MNNFKKIIYSGIIVFSIITLYFYLSITYIKTLQLNSNTLISFVIALTISYVLLLYLFFSQLIYHRILMNKSVKNLKEVLVEMDTTLIDNYDELTLSESIDKLVVAIKSSASREYLETILKKEAQLDSLQSQINPHFLYNILDSVRGDVLSQGLYETADMIEALSRFFRYGIGSSVSLITFEEEYKNVENYMKIQQYRFGKRIILVKDFDSDDQEIMNFKLPKMTLQPIVENAITHGIEGKLTQGKIVIRVFRTQSRMLITVEDNGQGMNIEMLEKLNKKLIESKIDKINMETKGNGVALYNVSERIKLLFGKEYGVYINSAEGLGTEVHMTLPFEKGGEN